MSSLIWKSLLVTPALLGASALISVSASAQAIGQSGAVSSAEVLQQVQDYSAPAVETAAVEPSLEQVTSVSQLSDVKPTDWAFQALQSLVERYGCIAGYPDQTYRGNRALTRYEFSAGLNACLDRINELIAASAADLVKKEDLLTLQRLQEEFAAELASLRGQVDALEARTTTLERQQFSTTTKLVGEAIFGVSGVVGDEAARTTDQIRAGAAVQPLQENTIFSNRIRLNLDTSFTGKDRLRTRLQARNTTTFSGAVTGTNMTRLGFDGTNNNAIELSQLTYRFPLTALTNVVIGTGTNDGIELNDFVPTLSPIESSGSGAVSRFGRFNPIYRSGTGTGIVINHKLGKEFTLGEKFTLSAAYVVPTGTVNNPATSNGLFNGGFTTLGQLLFQPSPQLGVAFTFAHSYYPAGAGLTGGTGSTFANNPFNGARTVANAFGLEASYKLNPGIIVSAWGGYTRARAKPVTNSALVRDDDKADIWTWTLALVFPDLFKEGNQAGIVFGQQPKLTSSDYGPAVVLPASPLREDADSSFHLEGFYRYRVNDNIAITPGFFVIFNPEGNDSNDNIYVGTIRTTFTF